MKKSILIGIVVLGLLLLAGVVYFLVVPAVDNTQGEEDTPNEIILSESDSSGGGANSNPSSEEESNSNPSSEEESNSNPSSEEESNSNPSSSPEGPTVVNLGTAGNFVILSKSGISTTGTTSIVGDVGVNPIDSTAITGFGLILDSSNQFATSTLVTGKVYAADYASPTPTIIIAAISDMEIAYTDAAGRKNPTATELGAGNIDGMTIAPGLYKWGTSVIIPTGVTLSGGANDVWIFQIAQDLTLSNGAIITLSGGAQTKNIFWQVAGQATLGTTSSFKGNILSQTLIEMNTGATLNGRALAQTAVTLDSNNVVAN